MPHDFKLPKDDLDAIQYLYGVPDDWTYREETNEVDFYPNKANDGDDSNEIPPQDDDSHKVRMHIWV